MASDTCGENLTWSLSGDTLTISGKGFESILCDGNHAKIVYYDATPAAQIQSPTPAPEKLRWKVKDKTLTVGGMREIPAYSYGKLPRVRSVDAIQKLVIEEGVEKISANAFSECRHPEF